MNLIGTEFIENRSGEKIKIKSVYKNIAISDSGEKIDAASLMNEKIYTPIKPISTIPKPIRESVSNNDIIDPDKFFNVGLNALAGEMAKVVSQVNLDDIQESTQNQTIASNVIPNANESIIMEISAEEEAEELLRKYSIQPTPTPVREHTETLAKYIDDFPMDPPNVKIISDTVFPTMDQPQQIIQNPVVDIFKNIKRTVDFNINISIKNKIPRIDFLEMMEDSYEISIINYLAEEFTNNLLKNPDIIKEQILSKIKSMVSASTNSKEKAPKKKSVRRPKLKIPN